MVDKGLFKRAFMLFDDVVVICDDCGEELEEDYWKYAYGGCEEIPGIPFVAFSQRPPNLYEVARKGAENIVFLLEDNDDQDEEGSFCNYQSAYTAIVSSIPLVVEEKARWKQIVEFRADKQATWKYQRLRAWTNDVLMSKTKSQADDLIGQKIEDYTWALKKHGFSTVTGSLKSVVSAETMTTTALAGYASHLLVGNVSALISAGLVITSKAALEVVSFNLEREDLKRGKHSEIAVLYEIGNKFIPCRNKS